MSKNKLLLTISGVPTGKDSTDSLLYHNPYPFQKQMDLSQIHIQRWNWVEEAKERFFFLRFAFYLPFLAIPFFYLFSFTKAFHAFLQGKALFFEQEFQAYDEILVLTHSHGAFMFLMLSSFWTSPLASRVHFVSQAPAFMALFPFPFLELKENFVRPLIHSFKSSMAFRMKTDCLSSLKAASMYQEALELEVYAPYYVFLAHDQVRKEPQACLAFKNYLRKIGWSCAS